MNVKKSMLMLCLLAGFSSAQAWAEAPAESLEKMVERVKPSMVTIWDLRNLYFPTFKKQQELAAYCKLKREGKSEKKIKQELAEDTLDLKALFSAMVEGRKKRGSLISPAKLSTYTQKASMGYFLSGNGSGVVVDETHGYILTNNHVVVQNALSPTCEELETEFDLLLVQFEDGRLYRAFVVGRDDKTDLALLKLVDSPENLSAVPFADSDELQVGQASVAIGSPHGLDQTVTKGIISSLDRFSSNPSYKLYMQLGMENEQYKKEERFITYIQTDAAINSGNSGGALLNLKGELIGINTAKHSKGESIGYAVPSNIVKGMLAQFKEYGFGNFGALGAMGNQINDGLRRSYKLANNIKGLFITEVLPNSASAKAGLKVGDILTSFNGKEISDPFAFRAMVATSGANSQATIKLLSKDESGQYMPKTLYLTLDSRALDKKALAHQLISLPQFGFDLSFDPETKKGCVISIKDKQAKAYGFEDKDRITEVNGKPVGQFRECFMEMERAYDIDQADLHFTIDRKGLSRVVSIKQ
ncbi:hypothetical protein A4G20_04915 [Pasteurellaceae bacterium RH1A]|nr:hypothetical protein A4G20_04915 [Pasteurellaceae bacterium RH1A]